MNAIAIEDRRDGTPRRLSARVMSAAVIGDPQFRVPTRPRLADGLVVVPLEGGLLVEGAGERQVLRGRAATTLLPQLLPLLDGSRTSAQAAAELAAPTRHVAEAVALLYTCGLLDDAPEREPVCNPEVAAFVRRHVDTTRVNRSAGEALSRLATTRVAIIGDGADELACELRRCGFASADAVPSADAAARADLFVALGPDGEALAALDDACAARGIPWVRSAADAARIEIGPYFDRRHTACYRCFAGLHDFLAQGPPAAARRALWTALLATELVHVVARVCQALTPRGLVTLDVDGGAQRLSVAPRTPGCPHCAPPPAALDRRPALALAHTYEQAVALPPRELLSPKDHQHHYKPANLALQHESKRCRGAATVPLARDAAPRRAGALTDAVLAELLSRTAGLRDDAHPIPGKVQRWAPTGGNLGSVQLHVLRPGGGAHLYLPHEHALAEVHARLDAGALVPAAPDGFGALIVFSAAYGRVRRKYGDFALRVVHLDGGVAQAQLAALAREHGLRATSLARWVDAPLLDALGLDGDEEPITGVVALHEEKAR